MDKKCFEPLGIEGEELNVDSIPEIENFDGKIELDEFKADETTSCGDLFSKEEIDKLKKEVVDTDDNEKANARIERGIESFEKVFDIMYQKIVPEAEKLFCDRNMTGEEFAQLLPNLIDSMSRNAMGFVEALEAKETASQKLVNAMNAYKIYKDACILQAELKLKEVQASKPFLDAELTKQVAQAKAMQFDASEQVMKSKFKQLEMASIEQEMRAKAQAFEANPQVQKLKYLILEYQAQGEEANAVQAKRKIDEINAQIRLLIKQRDGFRLDTKIKLLNVVMDGWKTGFIGGDIEAVPTVVTDNSISKLFHSIFQTSSTIVDRDFEKPITQEIVDETDTYIDVKYRWKYGIDVFTKNYYVDYGLKWEFIEDAETDDIGYLKLRLYRPKDGYKQNAIITVSGMYMDDTDPNDETGCCETSCNEVHSLVSSVTTSIDPVQEDVE